MYRFYNSSSSSSSSSSSQYGRLTQASWVIKPHVIRPPCDTAMWVAISTLHVGRGSTIAAQLKELHWKSGWLFKGGVWGVEGGVQEGGKKGGGGKEGGGGHLSPTRMPSVGYSRSEVSQQISTCAAAACSSTSSSLSGSETRRSGAA